MPTQTREPCHPLERYDLPHPAVPASLDGLTILHISDGHVRTPQARDPAFQRLLRAIRSVEPDLVVLTGDYMTEPGDELHALDALQRMRDAWRVRYGAFGVFGNHDSHEFKLAVRAIEGITWVENRVVDVPDLPLRLVGASYPEDLFGAMVGWEEGTTARRHEGTKGGGEGMGALRDTGTEGGKAEDVETPCPSVACPSVPSCLCPFPLALSHYPTEIFPAAEMGIPLMLAGHTHGGQIRLVKGHVPHTSSDIPSNVATGILRLRHTVCAVTRGIGEAFVGVRVNCPRQLPLYTLRRGPALVKCGDGEYRTLTQVVGW